MATLTDKQPREFSFGLKSSGWEKLHFALVLATLASYSDKCSYGARREDISSGTGLRWDQMASAIVELHDRGLLTIQDHQVGTAGITDTYYKLVDGCVVEMVLKLGTPDSAK